MKFLCDQCKAKYQISDDKIAGKTVRMKCRKCGYQIEVRAAVTETSVSGAPAGVYGASSAPPRPPSRQNMLATSLSTARPHTRPPQRPSSPLAGAFQRSVEKNDDLAPELLEISASDEWYVAVNGVPVGPIRISELRRKAAAGAVTDSSLVWQEGMEEWRPIKAIAELAAIVREAMGQGRSSVLPAPPRSSVIPPAPHAAPHGGALATGRSSQLPSVPQRPRAPETRPLEARPAATSRSNVVPITSRLATAERIDEPAHAELAPTEADPFALPPPAQPIAAPVAPVAPPQAAMAASAAVAAPMAASPSLPGTAHPSVMGVPAYAPPPQAPPKKIPWIPIGMVFLFGAFGVVGGISVFFNRPQPAPPPVVVQVPVPTPTPVAAQTDPVPQPAEPATATPTTPNEAPKVRPANGAVAKAAPAPSSSARTGIDVSSLLGGSNGPSAGPHGGAGGGSGSSLTAEQIQSVVRNRQPGVKRTCWERGGDQASSANVRVLITVGGNGQVQDASASGADPAMNKCIENQVRNWSFPPTGGTSRVEIPFHFVRQ